MRLATFFSLLLSATALTACAPLVIGGATSAGTSLAENRSLGRKVDDNVIYADLTKRFLEADEAKLVARISFNIRFGRVMLTGTAQNEEDARRAVALTWKSPGVIEVLNEVQIRPDQALSETASDSLVKRNLEARLLMTKDVWLINYSMDVTDGVAYLIGRVKDQGEMNRVMNVARTTKGVKRIVNHLEINRNRDVSSSDLQGQTSGERMGYQTPAPMIDTVDTHHYRPVQSGPIKSAPVSQDSTRPAP